MLDINVISFLGFLLLIFGLSISAFIDLKVNSQMNNFWRAALVFIGAAYAIYAVTPFINGILISFAVSCLLACSFSLGFLYRSWNTKVTNRLVYLAAAVVVIFGFIYENFRAFRTYQDCVALNMSVLSVSMVWNIYELIQHKKVQRGLFLNLVLVFSFLSLISYVLRMYVVVWGNDPRNINIFGEGVIAFASRWTVMAANVLTLFAINGYYTEKAWTSEKKALSTELVKSNKINALNEELKNADNLNNELSLVLLEKNRLLTSLSSSVKSSRAGIMASSFVHEINQSLTAARLNAEFLLAVADKPPDEKFIKNNLNDLINDIDKISVIITNVKRVFHNNYTDFKDVNLKFLVEAGIALIKDECEIKNIDLTVNVDSQLTVRGNQSQLEMVVLNLLNNSIDSLETCNGARSIVISSSNEDDKTLLSVEDNGLGVSLELTEKIFELFRTTKNDGMGFGLWLSRAVMENHQGFLVLDTATKSGARFVMQFRSSDSVE
jgi:signal transduction histidine kinase